MEKALQDMKTLIEEEIKAGSHTVVEKKMDPVFQTSATLMKMEPKPVLFKNIDGKIGSVLGNIFPDRNTLADRLGIEQNRFLEKLMKVLTEKKQKIQSFKGDIDSKSEVFGEIELKPFELDRIPVLTYFRDDGGPYITAGVWVVRDPSSGINLSYHRFMISGEGRGTVRVVERRGTSKALSESSGMLNAAVILGAPPAVLFAAALSPAAAVNEYEIAEKFGDLKLVSSGNARLPVPMNSQVVIEGRFTGERAPEGPFVDITGTIDHVRMQPVFEITRIALRRDPIIYSIVPSRGDHSTLMGIPKELDIYLEVAKVCRCIDVSMTRGGASWLHAVVSISKNGREDGKRAAEAAFRAHRSLKLCIVVDEDIDVRDIQSVEWALATRFQADRDLIVMKNMPGSSLDPSAEHSENGSMGAKMGLDATIPWGVGDRSVFKRVEV